MEAYLRQLQDAMTSAGADTALVQDALYDAEEHFQVEMAVGGRFADVAQAYGSPEEVAAAYLGTAPVHETAVRPLNSGGAPMQGHSGGRPDATPAQVSYPVGVQTGMIVATAGGPQAARGVLKDIFGVFADPRVWTSLMYMIVSLGLGVLYFTVVVTGLSTAGGMMVLIVGIPLLLLVLGMVRVLALFEGRVVEVLLSTRMPRRLRTVPPSIGFFQRIWFWLKDGRTWLSMLYMVAMLPLGVVYFTVAVTGLSTSLALITAPLWWWFGWADHTFIVNGEVHNWWFPGWSIPFAVIAGCLLLIGFMHLVKWIGRGHALFAKAMRYG